MNSAKHPSRREILHAALTTAAVSTLNRSALARSARSDTRPNIILLLTDDQRQETLGCYGNPVIQTPHIDSLARRGVRFNNAFSTTAICMSSRASILTGLYTRVHGIDDFKNALEPRFFDQSYPKLLKNNGYRTGFIGKWGVDGGEMPRHEYDFFRGYQGQGSYFPTPGGPHLTVTQTNQSLEFLRGCSAHQPFCLAVSFKAPHVQDEGRYQAGMFTKYPYEPSLEYLYADEQMPPNQTVDRSPMPDFLRTSLNATRDAPDFYPQTYPQALRDLYRLITGVDNAVGKIVAETKRLGFAENTVILYSADHGSFYGEHGFGGKWLMYEESIRIPMIIMDPRADPSHQGTACDPMVLNLDVPATVLELAEIPAPKRMQGRSLLSLANQENPIWRREFFYENHFRNFPVAPIAASEGIRTDRWKYIRYIDRQPVYEHLFDLKKDPREERNLATEPGSQVQLGLMRERWKIWSDRLTHFQIDTRWQDPAAEAGDASAVRS